LAGTPHAGQEVHVRDEWICRFPAAPEIQEIPVGSVVQETEFGVVVQILFEIVGDAVSLFRTIAVFPGEIGGQRVRRLTLSGFHALGLFGEEFKGSPVVGFWPQVGEKFRLPVRPPDRSEGEEKKDGRGAPPNHDS